MLAAAFGIRLIGQAMHMPASVLLTKPHEARWQALWTLTMAAVSVALAFAVAGPFGAVGVVFASAFAVFLA